jgi:hypothetical protein
VLATLMRDSAMPVLIGIVATAVAAPPAPIGAAAAAYKDAVYEPPLDVAVPASVRDDTAPAHDPARPTAVVLLGNGGANAGDMLHPCETLAATGSTTCTRLRPNGSG